MICSKSMTFLNPRCFSLGTEVYVTEHVTADYSAKKKTGKKNSTQGASFQHALGLHY